MARFSVSSMFSTSVLMTLLCLVQKGHFLAHFRKGPNSVTRAVSISQSPIYHEQYLECRNQICERADDYPEKEILRIMQDTEHIEGFFGYILNSTTTRATINIHTRFGSGKGERLCQIGYNGTFTPRVLRNVGLQWKYVVNVEGYHQRFTSEICKYPHGSTDPGVTDQHCTTFGYNCKQTFTEVYLLTYEDYLIDFDKFMIPTKCTCDCDS
ncbi:uncharacterized protein LOC126890423 isoform X1 [Diabrotica virgifera virgifera]|uniref:Spaetzle domain-containing protein n=1 Tax=Diabrotica virgifera virgifera TaxID=50390 RepID=A0ABM5KYN2_DIAVI|nr:uncharacterized protein LOC126890423 isoform X1 [Diabrotica virgifera virgifera]